MYQNNPYAVPPPPPYMAAPPTAPTPATIVVVEKQEATITNMAVIGDISECVVCNNRTNNQIRSRVGKVTFAWCVFLFLLGGPVLAFLPCCCNDCKDKEFICGQCGNLKTKIEANCF